MAQIFWRYLYCTICNSQTNHRTAVYEPVIGWVDDRGKMKTKGQANPFDDPEAEWECWACRTKNRKSVRKAGNKYSRPASEGSSCPVCRTPARIDVVCQVSIPNTIDGYKPIGYLAELECKICGTKFPIFSRTGTLDQLDTVIDNNSWLLKEGLVGSASVGVAQQMLSTLDPDSATSYLMGVLKSSKK